MASRQGRNYSLFWIKVIMGVLASVPLPIARFFGKLLAKIAWWAKARAARTTLQNINHCFPDWDESKKVDFARRSLEHTGQAFFETPIVWRSRLSRLQRLLKQVEGESPFRQAAEDSGVVIVPIHLGNWELVNFYLNSVTPFLSLYNPERMQNLQSYITECRSRFGSDFVEADLRGVLKLRRRLRDKGSVVIFPDQIPDTDGFVHADLFGQPAKTATLIPQILRQTGVPVFLVAAYRVKGGFDIQVTQPSETIYSSDLVESATALNQAIEEAVERDPAQYQWEYKRYRGAAEIYQ